MKWFWHKSKNWKTEWINSTLYTWTQANYTLFDDAQSARNRKDALPFISSSSKYPSNEWRCPSRNVTNCDTLNLAEITDVSQWAPYGGRVKYCLIESVEESCKLQFSLLIALSSFFVWLSSYGGVKGNTVSHSEMQWLVSIKSRTQKPKAVVCTRMRHSNLIGNGWVIWGSLIRRQSCGYQKSIHYIDTDGLVRCRSVDGFLCSYCRFIPLASLSDR